MLFGNAIESMKSGHRVARRAWSRSDVEVTVWVLYRPPIGLEPEKVNDVMRRFIPRGPVMVNGYFVVVYERIYKKDGEWLPVWQPGWAPSQDDLQADDWEVLPNEAPGVVGIQRPKLEIVPR